MLNCLSLPNTHVIFVQALEADQKQLCLQWLPEHLQAAFASRHSSLTSTQSEAARDLHKDMPMCLLKNSLASAENSPSHGRSLDSNTTASQEPTDCRQSSLERMAPGSNEGRSGFTHNGRDQKEKDKDSKKVPAAAMELTVERDSLQPRQRRKSLAPVPKIREHLKSAKSSKIVLTESTGSQTTSRQWKTELVKSPRAGLQILLNIDIPEGEEDVNTAKPEAQGLAHKGSSVVFKLQETRASASANQEDFLWGDVASRNAATEAGDATNADDEPSVCDRLVMLPGQRVIDTGNRLSESASTCQRDSSINI